MQHLLRVIPVIGILRDKKAFKPVPNPAEVEEVFDAPLEMFIKVFLTTLSTFSAFILLMLFEKSYMKCMLQDENRRDEAREWLGDKYLIHLFDYEFENKKYVIWGLTAAILITAASVVFQKPAAFLVQNPKFKLPRVIDKGTSM